MALPPPHVINALFSLYGIAYDFFLHDMEDNLPGGWAEWRGAPGQSRPQAVTLAWPGPAYLGLAWPGSRPEAGPRRTLLLVLPSIHPLLDNY